MLRRRALIAGLGAAAIGGGAARADVLGYGDVPAPASQDLRPRDRWLWLQNNAGEEVAVAYRTGQDYNIAALARLQALFRDLRADAPGPIPGLLLDMLSLVQERIGYTRPLRLISGYRTPQTNAMLPHAAPNSLHMRGMAADIVVRGMSQADVCAHASLLSNHLGFMGVGWYGSFTHIDIGPKASWTRMLN
ncbi:YcbK family protein [Roseomonas terrae]|uniref:Murein endopeptidase K n=1 Tax=Neoroseomonas terrae TaxID=424799 RepID=A0ABS5EMQ3_9PROT|nr:DUF882 domain-containing protein [Neoroseomonas terrae]MBR0652297.1 YcbK family protein [Neoroseomonas terrae]